MLILPYLLPPNIGRMLDVVKIEPFQGPIRPFLILVSSHSDSTLIVVENGYMRRWPDVTWSYHWYNKQCRDYLTLLVTRTDA